MALELTDSNFEEQVVNSEKLAVVDFWAEWCGPCKMVAPVIEELSKEYDGKVVIGKLDVDSNPEVSQAHGIRSIPTILFFKEGKVVDKQVGAVPKAALKQKIEEHVAV